MSNPTTTVPPLTAEEITALQKELHELRTLQAAFTAKHEGIRDTLHAVSDQLDYLVSTIPDGLGTSLISSQADGLSIILRHIKDDVEDVREEVRVLFQ